MGQERADVVERCPCGKVTPHIVVVVELSKERRRIESNCGIRPDVVLQVLDNVKQALALPDGNLRQLWRDAVSFLAWFTGVPFEAMAGVVID